MKGIIWYYNNKERALEELQKIVKDYRKLNISADVCVTTSRICAYFENGDSWHIVPCRESVRGMACNIGYIEYGTPMEVVERIIMPCIKSYPYQAYNYYFN